MGSWLGCLLTKGTSQRGEKQREWEEGLPLMAVHAVSITVPLPEGPEEAATGGS